MSSTINIVFKSYYTIKQKIKIDLKLLFNLYLYYTLRINLDIT
jgi:hypothetical protein